MPRQVENAPKHQGADASVLSRTIPITSLLVITNQARHFIVSDKQLWR